MRVSTAVKFAEAIGCNVGELFEEAKDVEFAAFVRYNGIHYTADSLEEFNKIVEEIRSIVK